MLKLATYEAWFDGEVIVPGDTLEQRLKNLEEWNFQGIQIQRKTAEMGVDALKKIFAKSPVKLCIFGGGQGLLAKDEATRKAGVERVKQGLKDAAALGAFGSIVVPIRVQPELDAPAAPKTIMELEREIIIEELKEIAPVAEAAGTKVILEPLNRYESHFLKTILSGAEVARAVGSPAITVMADFFHMNIEEVEIGKAIEEIADVLSYVHLADSNRYQPGAGHLDLKPGLAALKRIGYDGWLTFECKILGDDKGAALRESNKLIRDLWESV